MLTCFDDVYAARGTLRSDAPTCTRVHAYDARNGTVVTCISDHAERRLASKCVPLVVVGLLELTLTSLRQLRSFLMLKYTLQVTAKKNMLNFLV